MSKGFRDLQKRKLAQMIDMELTALDYSYYDVEIVACSEFEVSVIIKRQQGDQSFSYNALSEFGFYQGSYNDEIISATSKLFADITSDASVELEVN